MKMLVGLDGTLQSKDALRYGLERIKKDGGELVALHIFNSGLFVDYDAMPGVEDMARAESGKYVEEAKQIIREAGKGIRASLFVDDGNPAEEIINYARSKRIDVVLCPPRLKSVIESFGKRAPEECAENIAADATQQFEMACVTAPKN